MDPREVLLGVDIDELADPSRSNGERRSSKRDDRDRVKDLLSEVKRLSRMVEHEHDQRLRGIEINIRWLMVLVGGEVLAIVGYAIGSIAGVG